MRKALLMLILLSSAATAQNIIYDTGALITELNVAGQSDAYPWLSADGLRLYYSKDVDGTISHIGYAVRPDVTSPFQLVNTYLAGITVDGSSCWLTPDELTIYFTAAGDIRMATRTAIGEQFSSAVTITLLGVSNYDMRSPSLTPDGAQLYVRDFSTNDFLYFTQVIPNTFSIEGPVPTGLFQLGTGKLDHTGLSYYFSADDGNGHRIHRMSRNSLNDPFGTPQILAGDAFTDGYNWVQPAVAADETQLVLVRAQSDWEHNDLYLASGTLTVGVQAQWVDLPAVWPNPAMDAVNIQIPDPQSNGRLNIMDMNGRVVSSSIISRAGIIRHDVSSLADGIYVLTLENGRTSHRTTLIIAR